MLFVYDGLSIVIFISFLGACACFIFSRLLAGTMVKKAGAFDYGTPVFPFISNAYFFKFLKIKYVSGIRESGVIFEKWNPINRVTVTS